MAGGDSSSHISVAIADDVFSWVQAGFDEKMREDEFELAKQKLGIEGALTEAQTEQIRLQIEEAKAKRKWNQGLARVAGQRGLGVQRG